MHVLGLVGDLLEREQERALGQRARRGARAAAPTPLPVRAEIGKTSASRPRSEAACSAATVRVRSSRSTLLTATTTGHAGAGAAPRRSSGRPGPPTPCSPLSRNSAASASGSSCSTRLCIRSRQRVARALDARQVGEHELARRSGRVATPRIARRVVCGLSETIATFGPTIALTSVDLPTFGRPASATKPARVT